MIGPLGDRIGRKPAMLFCFGLMDFSILGMALTPSYDSIGWVAPVLVVVFRLLQGFAPWVRGRSRHGVPDGGCAQRETRALCFSAISAPSRAAILTAGLVGVALSKPA